MSYIPQVRALQVVRTGALASGFDSNPIAVRTQMCNQAILFLDYTIGSSTDARVRIEVATPAEGTNASGSPGDVAPVAADWYQLGTNDSPTVATAVSTLPVTAMELKLTATGKYTFAIPCNYKWLRVKAKATGTLTNAVLNVAVTSGMA